MIGIALVFGKYMTLTLKSGFYALSLTLEGILIFTMPGIIFSFLFSCMLSFKNKALVFVSLLFFAICVSNFISAILAYTFGAFTLPQLDLVFQSLQQTSTPLLPLWTFKLPYTISCEYALLIALGTGIFFIVYPIAVIDYSAQKLRRMVNLFLEKGFAPLLPLFTFGFILKMQHEGTLIFIIKYYGPILALIFIFCLIYLVSLYYIAAKFNLNQAYIYFKNVLPSGIMGFTTMSSIATLPVTLRAAEKNTKNPIISEAVISFTVNMHLIGDSIAIPFMALAILISFGQALPMFGQYLIFANYFVLCRFAVAAVPGGGILIVLPILENYLGFSAEMSVLITTLFIIFDPLATAVNVIGNGSFAILANQFFKLRKTDGLLTPVS
jgi:Na+/H+-dicarboxylate symporter